MKRKKAEDMLDLFHDRQDVEEKSLYPTWGRVPRDHGSRRGPMAQGSIWLTVAQADFGRPPTSDIIYVYRRLRATATRLLVLLLHTGPGRLRPSASRARLFEPYPLTFWDGGWDPLIFL